ncbi:LOW QUALITY PROTEIN: uncharacterized protein C22orf24 homolog [Suricata suricatta]|uniref:LOW QUALITY PROTEIN: uncharacterized protein C22orf24 homolog n=1 Tax=Suricata suricatta TaxID=37032 RepID=UPI00115588A8|nr:LOW QUALITY PROTEIN: uncharacterized protein C22orf24 homolog [Suricata suricatta]
MAGRVPCFSSEGPGYFTTGRSANNGMAPQEDKTGMLQRISVWTPCQNVAWKRVTRIYSIASHRAAVCKCSSTQLRKQWQAGPTSGNRRTWEDQSHRRLTPGLYPRSLPLCWAYNRCSVSTCQMTECILSVSGCHQFLRKLGRWEENVWTPATPYISSIFSES